MLVWGFFKLVISSLKSDYILPNCLSSLRGKNEIKLALLAVFSQEKKNPFIVGFFNFSILLKGILKVAAFQAQVKSSKLLQPLSYGSLFVIL